MCQLESAAPVLKVGAGDYCACPQCGGLYLDPYPARQTNAVFEGDAGAAEQRRGGRTVLGKAHRVAGRSPG